ncbi:MAG: B12-binding domain-containing radical SAM protein [Candidatus Omnitrophica bacterium]|nr:B12-binding domain-containing radical SAM protein [Candidatus Omnitrophota bacterium]
MRILFVYTDINTMGLGARSYHFGIGILSATMKQRGHQVELFYTQNKNQLENIVQVINAFKPDIIGFTADTTQIIYIKKILAKIKCFKKSFTVLGGCHASLYPECLYEIEGLDAICRGEGEETLVELAGSLRDGKDYRGIKGLWIKTENNRVVKNPTRPFISDFDALPFRDYDLFDYQNIINSDYGRLSFMLSRGCPFNCAYCASPTMGRLQEGKYVRFFSVGRAIAELKSLKQKYQFKTVFFADDIFTLNKDYVFTFCEKYKQEIGIPFEVNARIETISADMLSVLKETGCFKIHMGIEHGNEDFRKNILNRSMSNEQIIDAFKKVKEFGIATKSYNIIGFPFETKEIHFDTVALNQKVEPDAHVCYVFQPYPGTKLYDFCRQHNFIAADVFESEIVSRRDTVLNLPSFPRKEIVKCHRNFSYRIYRKKSLRKAIVYKIYYSQYGERLIKILSPVKNLLRNFAMK